MKSDKFSQSEQLKMTGRVHENIGSARGKQGNDNITTRKKKQFGKIKANDLG